ncbi:S66 peptidase family protein [Actinoalloteichus spitiensis]|uniref:S66 peptidase family protein n=1 Tax=Actinoalloteichus spitiensis TaxID=252394 RepID=UPI000377B692|nr:LD-carboxypeptidase [Actinoalloteichus spitiensis]
MKGGGRTWPDRPLRPGDRVAVVAPAGPVAEETLDRGLATLRGWGLEVSLGKHVLRRHPVLDYLAGDDVDRADDLTWALSAPNVRAVLCARGGYGSARTLRHLDWGRLEGCSPRLVVGSSDITVVHAALAARLPVASLFGPMVGTSYFVDQPAAREHLRQVLFAPDGLGPLGRGSGMPIRGGRASGTSWGGTLSLLAASLDRPDVPRPPDSAIALLEDIDEEPYRLDGMLTQLLAAGWFDAVAGVALGSWERCGPPERVRDVLADRLEPLGIPVAWEVGFGHCADQVTVPLNVPVHLDADVGVLTLPSRP